MDHNNLGSTKPVTPIRHRFIAIDEGLGNLLHIDEAAPSKNWRVPIGSPEARDLQLIGENKILVGHHRGFTEFSIETGGVAREFASLEGVTAVRRQPGGHTLISGVNLAGATGVVILELDANDREVHRAFFPGDYVRLIRQTNEGTYLMCCNDRIREGSRDGKYLREFPVNGFFHAWKAVRLANKNLLVSAGYGAFLVELDPDGNILRKFGDKGSVPLEVNPFFYAMFQLLPDGNIVVANWQGHGQGHGSQGIQLLEFNRHGEIVWQWSKPELISSLQGIVVLDGLDAHLLHDERNGLMTPISGGQK